MSLIYKSLQRVRNDAAAPPVAVKKKARPKRVYSSGMSKRVGVFFVTLAVFSLIGFLFFSWVQQEIERLAPRRHDTRPAMERGLDREAEQQEKAAGAEDATAAKVAQVLAAAKKKVQKALPPLSKPTKVNLDTRKKVGMEDLVKPTTDLEHHFAAKVRQNQAILSLEQRLVDRWRRGDDAGAKAALEELQRKAGAESFLVRKWQGMMALKEKRYAEAEGMFRSLLRRADDLALRINLVQVLAVQGKRHEADRELARLQRDFPASPKVAGLAARMGRH